jgi:hypothetical protein
MKFQALTPLLKITANVFGLTRERSEPGRSHCWTARLSDLAPCSRSTAHAHQR